MIFFSRVSSRVITPARPTSEPVPAVVGTAMIGAMPSVLARFYKALRQFPFAIHLGKSRVRSSSARSRE